MPADSDKSLAAGLAKIGLVLRHHAWESGGGAGLSPTQSQILAILAAREARGLSVSALAAELAVTQATASDAVSTLLRKKLIAKGKCTEDARVVLVRLTGAGKRAASTASQWPDFLLRALGALDPVERDVFLRGLIKMIHALQEDGRIPVARMCTSCTYFRPHAHPGEPRQHHCAYVNAPLGAGDLRLDCREHAPVEASHRSKLWQMFIEGKALDGSSPLGAMSAATS
jgi:DNA-binding MarR family transcriptional regulator